MLKKTIAFTDVDGNAATETHYFNLTTADLTKMQIREGEGFRDYINRIVESGDGQAIIDNFEKILRLSYGVRTQDGKFVKPVGAFDEFMASEAYSELFMELVTNAEKSAEFIRGIMPKDLAEKVQAAQQSIGVQDETRVISDLTVRNVSFDEPTPAKKDPRKMSRGELLAAYREKNTVQDRPISPYKDMPMDDAMNLSPAEFEVWVNVNQ